MNVSAVFVLLCFFALTQGKNDKNKNKDKVNGNGNGWKLGQWKKFLREYGYTSPDGGNLSPHEIKKAIIKLRILNQFDNSTTDADIVKFMEKPRCGNKDINGDGNVKRRVRRYDLNPAWRIKSFKYAFEKYSSDLTVAQQDSIAAQAFQLWKEKVPVLDFTAVDDANNADIRFSFETGTHDNCAQAFDGSGPILAHAYLPEDGRVHLDDAETFTDQYGSGRNLYSVLVHEIGHVLGLGHSFVSGAVMHPLYEEYNSASLALHDDDINGMLMLYDPDNAADPTCFDQDPSLCAQYEAEGYCIPDFADVMIETCPQTCNLCA